MNHITYKFRLYPTKEQAENLISWSHHCRFLWNHMLEANIKQYDSEKKFIFYFDMTYMLPKLKNEYRFLKEVPNYSLQNICKRLDHAIKRCYKIKAGFPKFKSKRDGDLPSIQIPQCNNHVKWNKQQLKIPKLGWVRWKKHRKFVGKLKSVSIKYEAGCWYACILCETAVSLKIHQTDDIVGIDLGLSDWIVTSDGELFDHHPGLKKKELKVKREQRKLSRKKKGSNNRAKQRLKLQRAHAKVRLARLDNAHKVSNSIAKNYKYVAMEDLNIQGMMKNKHLAASVSRAGWYQLKQLLSYKTNVITVDRWFPSSKTCSCCGYKKDKMPLNIRIFKCDNCELEINRDLNAAINLKNQINTIGTMEINACGDISVGDLATARFRHVSLKQEKFKVLFRND